MVETEKFILSNFLVWGPGKPSALVPGRQQNPIAIFQCPRCEHHHPEPEHGVEGGCRMCGLHWVAHGNSLELWELP